jgi:hypothetical protein
MRRVIAGAALVAVILGSAIGAHASGISNTPHAELPRLCVLSHEGHYSDAIPCSLAYALHAQGAGTVWKSIWVRPSQV